MEVGLRVPACPRRSRRRAPITLNARKLYEIAREVTAEEVVAQASTAGWVDVVAGRSRFKVVSLDPKDFPELPLGAGRRRAVPSSGSRPARCAR